MFGIIRPCRHRLTHELRSAWLGHPCGLCLALRDEHGQLARLVTNYDGLLVSVLVDAQRPGRGRTRPAGPCLLRGMRGADVAVGDGVRLAAAVSLALAAVKMRDHMADGDGPFGSRPVAAAARRAAERWTERATRTGLAVGFDTTVLLDAAARQRAVEGAIRPGQALETATEPTESAVAAAFAHTAVLTCRPGTAQPLREVGRRFGRIAHLLDAIADLQADRRSGAWNPILATGAGADEARRLCDEALAGLRLALHRLDVADGRLLHALLAHEAGHAVHRTFDHRGPVRPPALVPAFAGAPPGGPAGSPPQDLVAGLDRRREKANTRVLSLPELERLWSRKTTGLRERCLWRLLYETAARADEVLRLNVEDLDLANKRAVVVSKGGDSELLHFQTGSAQLLPRLIGSRRRGPIFLADRPPVASQAPASEDLCLETGRARLSYRRDEELFVAATRGRTLHDLRRAALTHLGEDNVSLPLLMAKSRHKNLRSLQRYVRPSPEAVAALTARHDPARRHPAGRA